MSENLENHQKNVLQKPELLLMLYEIGNAMRYTLRLDEILYIILTCVTAHEGLGFNRAVVFLVNEKEKQLEGRMGIGPDSGDDAKKIWKYIERSGTTLDDLLSSYLEFGKRTDSHLNNMVKNIKLPIIESSGILAKTVLEKKSYKIIGDDAHSQVNINDPIISLFNMDQCISVPLLAKNRVVGVMLLDNFYTKTPISEDDIWKSTMFANQAGLAIENSQEFEKTLFLSNTDRMTGLWNYGYFQHQLTEEIKRANRFNRLISLLMIDIDFFKKYNDKFGHLAGDKLLQEIAQILKISCREVDLVSRYGGEEFAIILPETHKEKAYSSAERIRKLVETNKFAGTKPPQTSSVTVSIGVASFPHDAQATEELVLCADKALYAAKNFGRNRVCMFSKELL